MMDILMSETCWARKKWNKIASDIKLVFYSSTITMMHGPINVRFIKISLVALSRKILYNNTCSLCSQSVTVTSIILVSRTTVKATLLHILTDSSRTLNLKRLHCWRHLQVDSSWNVMTYGDAREGKWRGNWRMEWVASTLHTTSEHGVSSITTADAHTSAGSSRLNWRPRWFKWTRPFRRKTKSGFCACAITFQLASTKIFDTLTYCLLHPM